MLNTSKKIDVMVVAGARPNFMKVAPILNELDNEHVTNVLVHTGQHYDSAMSGDFFEELGIKEPEYNLNVGSHSHAVQTARVMEKFEPVLNEVSPRVLIVVGDVNSTLATALVASKYKTLVAHVEAGLRSNDREMPEEINRVAVDHISDILYATSKDGLINLEREGLIDRSQLVGNVMVDTLLNNLERAKNRPILSTIKFDRFGLLTLHRPSNVDEPELFEDLIKTMSEISMSLPVIFLCHPRTRAKLKGINIPDSIVVLEPVSYLDAIGLEAKASVVFTDSGGMQEETTILGVPCLTLRDNTERPVTVAEGTNFIVGRDKDKIIETFKMVIGQEFKPKRPEYWDGKASKRIVESLKSKYL